jgi:hypothetical protein
MKLSMAPAPLARRGRTRCECEVRGARCGRGTALRRGCAGQADLINPNSQHFVPVESVQEGGCPPVLPTTGRASCIRRFHGWLSAV